MPANDRTHYRGDYPARARAVRQAAQADPSALCWRCGQPARTGDPWQAGHLRDADPTSPLAAEHRSCNTRAGAQLGHTRRSPLQPTRDWYANG